MRLGVEGLGVDEVGSGCGGNDAVCGVVAGLVAASARGGAAVGVGVSVMSRGETHRERPRCWLLLLGRRPRDCGWGLLGLGGRSRRKKHFSLFHFEHCSAL